MRNNQQAIDSSIVNIMTMTHTAIIKEFKRLGKIGVDKAKDHIWQNRTFNLEDSIGFAVYYNGASVYQEVDSKKASEQKDGKYGHDEAVNFLNSYSAGDGYTLVVLAGMYYALPLESVRGYDVLMNSFTTVEDSIQFERISNYYTK